MVQCKKLFLYIKLIHRKKRMVHIMWERELEIAKEAAILAGKEIMKVYEDATNMKVEYKDGNMPLTEADKRANHIIVQMLKKEFPSYSILSEEEKDNKNRLLNDYCFIVDPLDGTKEFIKRNGQFTVNIALAYQHRSVMGVIYVPVTGELYYGSEENGAFYEKDNQIQKISVSNRTKDIRAVMSSSHGSEKMEELIKKYEITNFIKIGSSLKGCLVAKGEAEVYYRHNPTMEWDTAAMQCIVEEAGGIFLQMDDTQMFYNREDSLNSKGFYIINCLENKMTLD